MSEDPGHRAARRLAAKRVDERVKLLASFFNALGVGAIGAGVIIPASRIPAEVSWTSFIWLAAGLGLHLAAHSVYTYLRSED